MTAFIQKLAESRARLTPAMDRTLSLLVSFAAGGLIALMLHYLLFRLTLPSTPFIYVAF